MSADASGGLGVETGGILKGCGSGKAIARNVCEIRNV